MDPSGGEVAAKRRSSDAGQDRISALPDDLLILILLRLDSAADACRTGVLSRRWRGMWTFLPELRFPAAADAHSIRAALVAHQADLRDLLVESLDAGPESVAVWLSVAAARVSGSLVFANRTPGSNDDGEVEGVVAFELPCFHRATTISMDLGFLGLAVAPAGVFARLTELALKRVRFCGPYELGDNVSSRRCPCLQKLVVDDAEGLLNLIIHSESLVEVHLLNLLGLWNLTVMSPSLRKLRVNDYLNGRKLVANISAPQLEFLQLADPGSVQLGETTQLQMLTPGFFHVYSQPRSNRSFIRLLKQLQFTRVLGMMLTYPRDVGNFQYLMGDLTALPRLVGLILFIINNGHTFGDSVFHVLRMCIGLKALSLTMGDLSCSSTMEAQSICPPGCICDGPSNWKTEKLNMNHLKNIEITGMKGVDHEVTFLKRLLNWATVLESTSITFDCSVSESKARELRKTISSFSRQKTHMEFYVYHNTSEKSWYFLAPDQDHGG